MTSFYNDTLYPLQDKVLQSIGSVKSSFYFTGGTALSRCYFHHRYSDDLDFFTHDKENFLFEVDQIIENLKGFTVEIKIKTDTYVSILINSTLKVEFVRDTGTHVGNFTQSDLFPRTDSIANILANKITALLGRDEVKDIVDLWIISKDQKINWEQVFTDANSKAAGILPPLVAKKIATFPVELLSKIQWLPHRQPSADEFRKDLELIIQDILALP